MQTTLNLIKIIMQTIRVIANSMKYYKVTWKYKHKYSDKNYLETWKLFLFYEKQDQKSIDAI